ncbi:MAG: tRNA preQ1(34) S-adenosylmethionine ribosyltransferase-isomerase QueA [Bdellovibrio sp. CG10_big_fil_rev_8_21_14_0_10_47_8]|nr:MAG: tRNA preQ1(34) S-adenosylmethionine ribosyltransferase-isomerase QueA [Bdellovibrio sp. CG10_big_fil_rev_8_21_14_0_10_47_8]
MKIKELQYSYPEHLVATEPVRPSRVLWVEGQQFSELTIAELIQKIPAGDVLVINDSKVLKRRVFAQDDLEVLFLGRVPSSESNSEKWQVLFPSRHLKIGAEISLPLGVRMKLVEKGRPQTVELSEPLAEKYFEQVAELPLPPYIQKARGYRHTQDQDQTWYQTAWAEKPGSFAAPTASLHFSNKDLQSLKERGVQVLTLTLHVGLGTFLPVTSEDLNDHPMHEEWVEIPAETWAALREAKSRGASVWALGTTATRSLESAAQGILKPGDQGQWQGFTDLLIQPGYPWQMVDRLLTNFHQPESTLLALVAGFSDLNTVKSAYSHAIEKGFRLFSYGDLSVWIRP